MPDLAFETALFPMNSPRGYVILILAIGGSLLYANAAFVVAPERFALPVFAGSLFLLTSFILRFDNPEFAADKDQQRYRRFTSLLGMRFGQWQELPSVTGVVMKYFSEYNVAGRRGWQVESPYEYYIVLLSTQATNHRGIIVHKFPHRQQAKALMLTNELATYFAVIPQFYAAK